MICNVRVICVIRTVNGKEIVLPLVDQHKYSEWIGCFSLIKELDNEFTI